MTSTPFIVHLIRHGEVHNPRQILYGRLPRFHLTDHGRSQALVSANHLKTSGVDGVYSSPLLRARQTAQTIIGRCDPALKLHISALLNEVCSPYEGTPGADVDERQGDIYSGTAACYEQPQDVVARVLKFIGRMRRNHPGSRIAAVTHGDIITFTVLWAKGFALEPKNKTGLLQAGYPEAYPAHASITTLTYHSESMQEKPTMDYFRP